jgi:hypothetical protein
MVYLLAVCLGCGLACRGDVFAFLFLAAILGWGLAAIGVFVPMTSIINLLCLWGALIAGYVLALTIMSLRVVITSYLSSRRSGIESYTKSR